MANAQKSKPKILGWKGLVGDEPFWRRLLVCLAVLIIEASLTFTQLGFVGVGMPGSYIAYAIVLFAPLAVGSLLLGTLLGTLQACLAGVILCIHAAVQPLDYYEMSFINPGSTTVLFALTGFMFGITFAFALRKCLEKRRRFVYVAIICLIGSICFSTLFWVQAVIGVSVKYVELLGTEVLRSNEFVLMAATAILANEMGDVGLQVLVDAALAAIACIATLAAVRWIRVTKESHSVPGLFRIYLSAVVTLVFAITAGLSFAAITEQSKYQARVNADEEIHYLIARLKSYEQREQAFDDFVKADSQSEKALDESERKHLEETIKSSNMLDGYTAEADGIVVIFKDDKVLLSDDPTYAPGLAITDVFSEASVEVIKQVGQTSNMEQVDYNPQEAFLENREDLLEFAQQPITSQIMFMSVGTYENYLILFLQPAAKVFEARTATMMWTTFSAFILLLTVFVFASYLLRRTVVRRIDETNGVLSEITAGNLDARVDIRDTIEFKSLSKGINTTVDALKESIAEAETRMDRELSTAKAIQESALPRIFPPFPSIHRFDVYASMNAAREVGGDFYDFFLIGDDSDRDAGKLGFVIADVSGKGVPAALFMMTAKTQVRNYLESGVAPGEAIENANRQLCEGNDAGMFVTVFAGVLDYGNGHVTYVNAGHHPPLLWQNNEWRWLKDVSGMPLGLFDGLPYDQFEVDLQIGDQFLLYTDGVTEAMNVDGALFGEDRLEAIASEHFYLHPRALVSTVRRELAAYAAGAEQSDDITMLALEYGVPPELTATFVVPADVAELPNVLDFVHAELDRRLCPVKAQNQLDIAIEELFVNVAHYAYPEATPDAPGHALISYTYSADPPSIEVAIIDKGIPYNPLAKPDAVTPDDIMDVPIGGLGILMAKKSVDEMEYERVNESNIVTIRKKW